MPRFPTPESKVSSAATTRLAAASYTDSPTGSATSCNIVAVRPRQLFVRYFRTMQRLNTPLSRRGVKGGSDGT